MDDSQAMERCFERARATAAAGNQPYGSVIVLDGLLLAEGENRAVTDLDPTAHAETVAIRRACQVLGRLDLTGGIIYANGEPCWGCSSAIRSARLARVVYAAPSFWATGGATSDFPILRADNVAGLGPAPEVVGGLLEEQARALFAELGWPPR